MKLQRSLVHKYHLHRNFILKLYIYKLEIAKRVTLTDFLQRTMELDLLF